MKRQVPSHEESRKLLLHHKFIFCKKIIEYCDELGIDELKIPNLGFDEPFRKHETIEEELDYLAEKVQKYQRVLFELQIALATKQAKQRKLKYESEAASKKECIQQTQTDVAVERKAQPIPEKAVKYQRFPRQTISEPKKILTRKLKAQHESRVKAHRKIVEEAQQSKEGATMPNVTKFDAGSKTSTSAAECPKESSVSKKKPPPLTIVEINALLERMSRPIPKPISPIKSPDKEARFFPPDFKSPCDHHPVRKRLRLDDSQPPPDLNSELINSAILTSLSVR